MLDGRSARRAQIEKKKNTVRAVSLCNVCTCKYVMPNTKPSDSQLTRYDNVY